MSDFVSANLDPELVEAAFTEPRRASRPVCLCGRAAGMFAIKEIAGRNGPVVFADIMQSQGSVSDAGVTEGAGTALAFSCYPTNSLRDGGEVATDDDELAVRIRSRRSHGQGNSKYDHVDTGWNSHLDLGRNPPAESH